MKVPIVEVVCITQRSRKVYSLPGMGGYYLLHHTRGRIVTKGITNWNENKKTFFDIVKAPLSW